MGTHLAVLKFSGTNPDLNERFNKWQRGSSMLGAISFKSLDEIPSGPALVLGLMCLSVLTIISGVTV